MWTHTLNTKGTVTGQKIPNHVFYQTWDFCFDCSSTIVHFLKQFCSGTSGDPGSVSRSLKMEKSECEAYFCLSSEKILFPEQQENPTWHIQKTRQWWDEVITGTAVEKNKTRLDQKEEVKLYKLLIVHCNSVSVA